MCAILGANSHSLAEILIDVNSNRGTFSSGLTILDRDEQLTIKLEGLIDLEKIIIPENSKYYICHLQAPTSDIRTWTESTSHPFSSTSWQVFHNGVINNVDELISEYGLVDVNSVDTSIIPALLQYHIENNSELRAHEIISNALNVLKGTFALCIIDTDSNEVYICRQGSTLFCNKDSGAFSSIKGEGYTVVPEGDILQLRQDLKHTKWKKVDSFKTTSPFIFL
jgi:glutamine---fructose-6-phosphate transaminase (isomerizing)